MRSSKSVYPIPTRLSHRRRVAKICLVISLTLIGNLASATEELLWFRNGRPTVAARQAVDILGNAAADGLDVRDYDADRLRDAVDHANNGSPLASDQIARLDQALTVAMRRYLGELRTGRVDPQQIAQNFRFTAPGFDPDALLRSALAENRLADTPARAAPPLLPYGALREALARYRGLADNPAWQRSLPPLPSGRLNPGENYAGVALLAQRLLLLGDLPAGRVAGTLRWAGRRSRQGVSGAACAECRWGDRQ